MQVIFYDCEIAEAAAIVADKLRGILEKAGVKYSWERWAWYDDSLRIKNEN